MFSFWNETLKNISQDQRKDKFVFIINETEIEVPLSYALGISPYITQQYLKDPTFREMKIQDEEKIEKDFSDFIRGKEIKKDIFIKIAKLLKNKEMIKTWEKSSQLTKETVIEYIQIINEINDSYNNNKKDNNEDTKEKENNGIKAERKILGNDYFKEIEEEILYIRAHLEEMKEEVKKMNQEELIYIIRGSDINVKSEDIIWEICKDRIKEMKEEIYVRERNRNNIKNNNKIYRSNLNEIERIRKIRRILLRNVQIKNLNKKI